VYALAVLDAIADKLHGLDPYFGQFFIRVRLVGVPETVQIDAVRTDNNDI
jgi:hypothetical protein